MTPVLHQQDKVAVLGLGRMGSAVLARLEAQGWPTAGWTRSRSAHLAEAVDGATVLLLCLYDAAACEDVLDRIDLPASATIVNTGTIGPGQAQDLAARYGAAYVHAPVIGSVPAAVAGRLQIVAAGAKVGRLRPVLEDLGEVLEVEDARTAAALKLVANDSLAGAVMALREALQQAEGLGLSREQALDVLARGPLGGLVQRKRDVLLGQGVPTEFTAHALGKDLALLADATGLPVPAASEFSDAPAGVDVAAMATLPAVDQAVLEPLRLYAKGHATGDPAYFREAFRPTAHIEGLRDGRFVSWPLAHYLDLFAGTPAPDEASRWRRLDSVAVHGTVATASMTLHHGDNLFTDVFLLVEERGRWRIANKAYDRRRSTP